MLKENAFLPPTFIFNREDLLERLRNEEHARKQAAKELKEK